jgi:hypothetical protein
LPNNSVKLNQSKVPEAADAIKLQPNSYLIRFYASFLASAYRINVITIIVDPIPLKHPVAWRHAIY